MKPTAIGRNILLREVTEGDAEFIVKIRTDPVLGCHLSKTSPNVDSQKSYIRNYQLSETDYYFVICGKRFERLGTVRIYDIQDRSFCWGSWIVIGNAPRSTALKSALLIYDFGFYALHYAKSHFDIRKANTRVVDFHKRFGARLVSEDDLNVYMEFDREAYRTVREKYQKFLP